MRIGSTRSGELWWGVCSAILRAQEVRQQASIPDMSGNSRHKSFHAPIDTLYLKVSLAQYLIAGLSFCFAAVLGCWAAAIIVFPLGFNFFSWQHLAARQVAPYVEVKQRHGIMLFRILQCNTNCATPANDAKLRM